MYPMAQPGYGQYGFGGYAAPDGSSVPGGSPGATGMNMSPGGASAMSPTADGTMGQWPTADAAAAASYYSNYWGGKILTL